MQDAIISIKPEHVKNIVSGKKTVELRTRSMNLELGSKLWIYSTLPVGKIIGAVTIDFLDNNSPINIWTEYKTEICITEATFKEYTKDRANVTVIGFKDLHLIENAPDLETLRIIDNDFMPPQFFSRLSSEKKIFKALQNIEAISV